MAKFKIESGVQLLTRLNKRSGIKDFYTNLFQPGLKQDDTVEIIGSTRSCLLADILCEALLYKHTNEKPLSVLVFNCAGVLNYKYLITLLKTKMNRYISGETELESEFCTIISKLFIVDIYDATQFYATIHNLDNILSCHNISLMIFDCLTAFYWSEQVYKLTKMDIYIKNLLNMIKKISKDYKVITIYSIPENFTTNELQMTDGISYKVQLLDNDLKGLYKVNVKTLDSNYTKCFSIFNNELKWQIIT